jgi:hypothetical protein
MKNLIYALGAIFLMASCADKEPEGNLHISGNIDGLQSGTIYIQRIVDTSLVSLDTIRIDGDSHFESHLTIESPEMLFLYLDRGPSNSLDDRLPFFAEPGKMTIETKLDKFYAAAQVTGSENHKLYDEFRKGLARYNNERLELTEARIRAQKKNNTVRIDSINKAEQKLLSRKYLFATNFAINNRDREIAPYIAISEIYDINFKYLDTIYKSMSPKVAESRYGKQLTEYYNDRKKAGL